MGSKQDPHRSYGQKIITLFVKLLFTRDEYSLSELAAQLRCSKQSVLRLLDDLQRAYRLELEERREGNRKYIRLRRPERIPPPMTLSDSEYHLLLMCRDFTAHLMGQEQFAEATRALEKSQALLAGDGRRSDGHFAVFRPGTIDYTPQQAAIRTLVEAMEARRIVELEYHALDEPRPKTLCVKPLKLFAHREALYLHARLARRPGRRVRAAEYDPLLAVHRIRAASLTERRYEFPRDYDFDAVFNRHFGVIKGEPFEVEIEFKESAARYAAERTWSPDQRLEWTAPDVLRLTFRCTSEWELLAWVFSFRERARLVRPDWLVARFHETLAAIRANYDHAAGGGARRR